MAKGKPNEILVSFESGHYKSIRGKWLGDSVWTHFAKDSGGTVHVNKDLVEYYETFGEAEADSEADSGPGLAVVCPMCGVVAGWLPSSHHASAEREVHSFTCPSCRRTVLYDRGNTVCENDGPGEGP